MISGAPGSGKTTLALAKKLNFALLSKDIIKKTLFDNLGKGNGDFAENRKIGSAAMQLLWNRAELNSNKNLRT